MPIFFVVGGVVGWLATSFFYGRLLPVMSLPTIISVIIGGIIGTIVGFAIAEKGN